jgi:cysteine desulfurase/selenocysteine lyase
MAIETEAPGAAPTGRGRGFDPEVIRRDFPILDQEINGHRLVYLDSAATSQKPKVVLDTIDRYYREYNANVHRGIYTIGEKATAEYEAARAKVARFINAPDSHEIVFTRNATEAINLVAYSWGRANVSADDLVVISQMEHHSNIVPWQMLGSELAYVPIDDDGILQLDALDELLARGPKLVAVAHVSNVLGTINPIAEITRRAHAAGALVLVDGAQAVPSMPVDVAELGADFYAWTGHKAYGPTGIGVLHGRRELLEAMPPFLGGGHMIARVGDFESTWAEPPARFEAGTMPIAESIGLHAAVDWLSGIGMAAVREHGRDITAYALERLSEVDGLTYHGTSDPDARGALVSFELEGIHPHDVAEILGRQGVCVRAGHHCAQPLMRRLGATASTRASIAVHTTREDIDALVAGLAKVQEVFA